MSHTPNFRLQRQLFRRLVSFSIFSIAYLLGIDAAFAQLNGSYTIGGSDGNYATFNEAVAALTTEGISGPVTFSVRPGTYRERVEIKNISGSSCEIPIVFEGEAGSSARVILQAPDASFAVKVDQVAGVSFRSMNIIGANPVVMVAPGTDCFGLEDNLLNGLASGPLVNAPSTPALRSNHHRYRNNIFSGGGIVKENTTAWNPGAPVFDEGLVIEGNKVDGISIRGQRGFSIRDNQLYNSEISVTNSWYGEEISKNVIEIDIKEYQDTAINIQSGAAARIAENQVSFFDGGVAMQIVSGKSTNDEILIANNIIAASGYYAGGNFFDPIEALIALGVRSDFDNTIKLYHNTLSIAGYADSRVPSYVLSLSGENNSFDVKNNILLDRASGGTLAVENPAVIAEMDYNNLTGLAEWQRITGFDQHSISVNTVNPDPVLQGAGIYVSEVPRDIYGQDRNNPPTIGAIEEPFEASMLSGSYTIGGDDGDYLGFAEAIADLNRFGVADSVVFRVRPGTYTEQVSLVNLRRNKIVFEGVSQDSTAAVLGFPEADALTIREASGIIFRYLTIQGITLTNGGGVIFEHNVIENGFSAFSEGPQGSIGGFVFRSNLFKGQEGIYLEGNDRSGSATVVNNTFDVVGIAISMLNLGYANEITDNHITARASTEPYLASGVGILVTGMGTVAEISRNTLTIYGDNALGMYFQPFGGRYPESITKNKIVLPDGGTGMEFAVGAGGSLVSNNMIAVRGNETSQGIAASEGSFRFYNNSVYIYGENSPNSTAFNVADDDNANITLKNNILANLARGYVLSSNDDQEVSNWLNSADYNDLYTNGDTLARWGRESITAANLDEWQSMTGYDANSLSVDPQFTSLSDLTPNNKMLAKAGTSLPEVEEDFFGNERPNPPTIGAVELDGEKGNQPPTANAGSDRTVTLPRESVIFQGLPFDADGRFVAFRWEKVSGPLATLKQANTAVLIVQDLVPGEYVFRFSATDNDGATASDEVMLTVKSGVVANQPPTANAGRDRTLTQPVGTVQLSGTGYDPDGVFRAFRWEKLSGPSATLRQQNTANLILSDLRTGEYIFRFTVTDDDGASGSDEVVLTVMGDEPTNQPPVANAGRDKTLTLPNNSTILQGGGTDADGVFRGFRWEKVSGPAATLRQQNTANLILSDLVAGEYVFRFFVTDDDGATDSDEIALTVKEAPNATPLASNTRVTAYPNTFRDRVNVEIKEATAESYQLSVYDAQGRVYYQEHVTAEPWEDKVKAIDLSNRGMRAGVYFVSINSSDYRKVIRVVKSE